MKKTLTRAVALLISVLTVFGAMTFSASAAADLEVYDILKVNCDDESQTCYTIRLMFAAQYSLYNPAKQIKLINERGDTVAYGYPQQEIQKIDFYAYPDNSFGVRLSTELEYTLVIPEGTYYTVGGVDCAEYRHTFTGVFLSNVDFYTVKDLKANSFMATKYTDNILYKGKLFFDPAFDHSDPANSTIALYLKGSEGGKTIYTKVADVKVLSVSFNGSAELSFGDEGVAIDKYASYRFVIDYASFYNLDNTYCSESTYDLPGKRLLKIREDYPFMDLLIKWFGKDHKVIEVVLKVLEILSKIKLVDTAYYKDIKAYVASK